jgi:hypothetical protein
MLTRFADGFASLLAALASAGLTLPPAWFTHLAIRADLAGVWAYAPAVLLAIVGLILTAAFARKAARGIAPSRDRAR